MTVPTKAIILAAGVGRRLGGDITQPPKCLLEFGGKSLLHRHLELLWKCGVSEVALGVGYQAERINTAIENFYPRPKIFMEYNEAYELGSIVTLWVLRRHLKTSDDLLLMDADVLYHQWILERLIQTDHRNCFLMDRDLEAGEEPMKLCVRQGKLVEFRKQVTVATDFCGESVGFFRFAPHTAHKLLITVEHYVNGGRSNEPYEEAVRDVLLTEPQAFGFEDITGIPWIEIDFQEDVETAQNKILPQI
jgi:choline kinase